MKRSIVVLLHIGYWLVFAMLLFVLYALAVSAAPGEDGQQSPQFSNWLRLMASTTIIPGIINFYLCYTLVFKRYLEKRKIALFLVAIVISSVISGAVGIVVGAVPSPLGGQYHYAEMNFGTMMSILFFLSFIALLHGVIGLVLRGFITWYSEIRIKEALTSRNLEMELNLIKSQINPHFLFNTINNIDVLIAKEPEKASLYLNQLSDIMRFMLYETHPDKIPFQVERDYIDKYIALHRIRNANPDYVHFRVTGNDANCQIPPNLFTPFIENAFKHVGDKKRNPAIDIAIDVQPDTIVFTCSNHYYTHVETNNNVGGLGNPLIQRRLDLLFPGKHKLDIQTDNNMYVVHLTISL